MSTDFVTDMPISFEKLKPSDHMGVRFDSINEYGDIMLTELNSAIDCRVSTY